MHKKLQANENILWLMLGLALLLLWVTIIMLRSENERATLEQSQKRLRIIDAFSQAYVAIMLVKLREGTVEVLKTAKGSGSWPRSTRRKPPQKKPAVPMPPRRIFCAA